ncbi:TadE family type IV pilus minor pilin [Arthrobacter flavus]|uniref:TadE family type IV pilus minor pilin n=1 Tax=Arthrobacter flavus TaxID=95172 RepID=A0ABW4Q5S2_9MICC
MARIALGKVRQRGAVTAEIAIALPSLVLLLALLLGTVTAGLTQLRLEEAARAGAREVVRGEPMVQVQTTVRRLAGGNVQLDLVDDGGWSTVTVTSRLAVPLLDQLGWELSASASARSELDSEGPAPSLTGTAGRYHQEPEGPIRPNASLVSRLGPVSTAEWT